MKTIEQIKADKRRRRLQARILAEKRKQEQDDRVREEEERAREVANVALQQAKQQELRRWNEESLIRLAQGEVKRALQRVDGFPRFVEHAKSLSEELDALEANAARVESEIEENFTQMTAQLEEWRRSTLSDARIIYNKKKVELEQCAVTADQALEKAQSAVHEAEKITADMSSGDEERARNALAASNAALANIDEAGVLTEHLLSQHELTWGGKSFEFCAPPPTEIVHTFSLGSRLTSKNVRATFSVHSWKHNGYKLPGTVINHTSRISGGQLTILQTPENVAVSEADDSLGTTMTQLRCKFDTNPWDTSIQQFLTCALRVGTDEITAVPLRLFSNPKYSIFESKLPLATFEQLERWKSSGMDSATVEIYVGKKCIASLTCAIDFVSSECHACGQINCSGRRRRAY